MARVVVQIPLASLMAGNKQTMLGNVVKNEPPANPEKLSTKEENESSGRSSNTREAGGWRLENHGFEVSRAT
jgi:hypothetical protein